MQIENFRRDLHYIVRPHDGASHTARDARRPVSRAKYAAEFRACIAVGQFSRARGLEAAAEIAPVCRCPIGALFISAIPLLS